MTQTPSTPAGWYPQGNVERWWDGNAWTDHTRPIQPTQPVQPQPAYGAPQATQPQGYYPVQPVKQSHTARNILIILAVLFLLFVGGCFAVVAIVGNTVNDAVDETLNDDTPGGPNVALEIEPGEGFEVAGFEYADGWSVGPDSAGNAGVQNLKVTNDRDEADYAIVLIKLLNDNEVLATVTCESPARLVEDTTVTLECFGTEPMPTAYNKVTINDAF
jgi:Protein of unknown function (DUF2510)